uniref:Helix-turn-helix domain-containing protein n=1 Tax=Candidatus Kentrum sp. LPFa TaxID=2126335 RepID=A0A450WTN9_9GAMM|nr:MAG: Helix-turn-helix domain-containing protein [Candidatus Kentron sp. LPFa]
MMQKNEKLREERKRLGYNQADFAAIGGITVNTQYLYEKGKRSPDSVYLSAISKAGADVLYILTGKRSVHEDSLKPEEEALLDNYRNSSEDSQRILRETSAALAQQPGKKRKTG